MAGIWIGVSSVARKVKPPYIGVSSVARKVKAGYIGVASVARKFFSGLEYTVDTSAESNISSYSVNDSSGITAKLAAKANGFTAVYIVIYASDNGLDFNNVDITITTTVSWTGTKNDDTDAYVQVYLQSSSNDTKRTKILYGGTETFTLNYYSNVDHLQFTLIENRTRAGTVTLKISSIKIGGVEIL